MNPLRLFFPTALSLTTSLSSLPRQTHLLPHRPHAHLSLPSLSSERLSFPTDPTALSCHLSLPSLSSLLHLCARISFPTEPTAVLPTSLSHLSPAVPISVVRVSFPTEPTALSCPPLSPISPAFMRCRAHCHRSRMSPSPISPSFPCNSLSLSHLSLSINPVNADHAYYRTPSAFCVDSKPLLCQDLPCFVNPTNTALYFAHLFMGVVSYHLNPSKQTLHRQHCLSS